MQHVSQVRFEDLACCCHELCFLWMAEFSCLFQGTEVILSITGAPRVNPFFSLIEMLWVAPTCHMDGSKLLGRISRFSKMVSTTPKPKLPECKLGYTDLGKIIHRTGSFPLTRLPTLRRPPARRCHQLLRHGCVEGLAGGDLFGDRVGDRSPHGCGCQNCLGIPFWLGLVNSFTTHFGL